MKKNIISTIAFLLTMNTTGAFADTAQPDNCDRLREIARFGTWFVGDVPDRDVVGLVDRAPETGATTVTLFSYGAQKKDPFLMRFKGVCKANQISLDAQPGSRPNITLNLKGAVEPMGVSMEGVGSNQVKYKVVF